MKTKLFDIEFKNGLLMSFLLGTYFLLLVILGLSGNTYFKIGNALIASWIIYHTVRTSKVYHSGSDETSYLTHLFAGFKTGIIGTLLSLVGLTVFLFAFPNSLDEMLSASIIPVSQLWQLYFSLLIEGMSGSIIVSLLVMQYWKNFEYKKAKGFVERTQ